MSKIIKSFRLVDSVPRFLAVNPKDVYEDEKILTAEHFLAEKMALESKKLEIEIARERILLEARQQAEVIVGKAREEAETIIQQAQNQEQEITEHFRQIGWKEGREQGLQQAQTDAAGYLQEAEDVLKKAQQERKNIIQGVEAEIVLLTLDIAKRIIQKEVELGPNVIKEIAQQAIKKAAHRERIIIRANSIDLEYLEKEREFLREKSGSRDLIILPDPTVEPGGCVLETDLGTVDARIDTQLSQIRSALLKIAEEKEENSYESS